MTLPVRVFGLDPGSSHAACAGLDAAPKRPALIAARTWPVGHWEALAVPVPVMQRKTDGTEEQARDRDGNPVYRTRRHVTTAAEISTLARTIVAWLLEHDATHLRIEDVERMVPGDSIAATTSMGTGLIQSGKLAEAVYVLAQDKGIEVDVITRQRAYSIAVGGTPKGRGARAEEALRADVDGWAERPREGEGEAGRADHDRDACVAALAGVRLMRGWTPPMARRKRSTEGPRPPRVPLTPEQEKARAERYAARLDAIERKKRGDPPRPKGHRRSLVAERADAALAYLRSSSEGRTSGEVARACGFDYQAAIKSLKMLTDRGDAKDRAPGAMRPARTWTAT